MAANPMTQFEVYRIGPEIKVGSDLIYHLQMQVCLWLLVP